MPAIRAFWVVPSTGVALRTTPGRDWNRFEVFLEERLCQGEPGDGRRAVVEETILVGSLHRERTHTFRRNLLSTKESRLQKWVVSRAVQRLCQNDSLFESNEAAVLKMPGSSKAPVFWR